MDILVPQAGLEPARLSPGDFKSPMSTDFITGARLDKLVQPTRMMDTRLKLLVYFKPSAYYP